MAVMAFLQLGPPIKKIKIKKNTQTVFIYRVSIKWVQYSFVVWGKSEHIRLPMSLFYLTWVTVPCVTSSLSVLYRSDKNKEKKTNNEKFLTGFTPSER